MRSLMFRIVALSAVAGLGLSACDQRQEVAEPANVTVNPPDNITVVAPQPNPSVTINPPDLVVNPPAVIVAAPDGRRRESTTVSIPGAGSITTTTEKR